MRVTGITELSKTRCRIELDWQLTFVLYKGELRLYHIKEGEELREEDYCTIMKEVLPKRARLRCMNLLKSREYTTEQLRTRLRQGLYPEDIIEDAVSYVASFHYIDDLRYAVDYITCHESARSRRRIEQDLYEKGISRQIMEKAWERWEALGGKQDEQAMIQALLAKKHYDPENTDYKEKQKIYAFLMRKGYSGEQVRRALGVGI